MNAGSIYSVAQSFANVVTSLVEIESAGHMSVWSIMSMSYYIFTKNRVLFYIKIKIMLDKKKLKKYISKQLNKRNVTFFLSLVKKN